MPPAIGLGLGLIEVGVTVNEEKPEAGATLKREQAAEHDRAIAAEHDRKFACVEYGADRVREGR